MKKIVIINHSDTKGGASVVSYRLMQALCARGVDARMVVTDKQTDSLRVSEAGTPGQCRRSFLKECLQIYTQNGFNRDDLFKISTGTYGLPIHKHPWVQDADAIILGWINQGTMSLDEIVKLHQMGKPIAWTLHDMWPVTGVCHHAGTCTRYMDSCGNCPLICGGKKAHDLSWRVFRHKSQVYDQVPIDFVAISHWMAEKCAASALTANQRITVIPNAFPIDDYSTIPTVSRGQLGLPPVLPLVVMGAARLDDPVKDLPLAVETLNAVADSGVRCAAVFYGEIRDSHALDGLKVPYVSLGTINMRQVAQIYTHAAVVLSTSRYETLPGTLIEGMAGGAVPVATSSGGQPDIIDHGVNGYLAQSRDPRELADLIVRAIGAPFGRSAQHASVVAKFSSYAVADKYIRLFNL